MIKRIAATLAVFALILPGYALYEKGGVLGESAAATGAAGAVAARVTGPEAVFYNPAMLYRFPYLSLGLMYGSMSNTKTSTFSFIITNFFAPYGAAAFSGSRLFNPESVYYEEKYSLTMSVPLYSGDDYEAGAGVNLKYLSAYFGNRASTVGLDAGFFAAKKEMAFIKEAAIGFFWQDAFNRLRWDSGREEEIDTMYKLGGALVFLPGITLSYDADFIENRPGSRTEVLHKAGAELKAGFAALRAGYAGYDGGKAGFTAGLGLAAPFAAVDYSYSGQSELGATHKVDFRFTVDTIGADYVMPPSSIDTYSGENKAYIKWVSTYPGRVKYRLYITGNDGKQAIHETVGGEEVNFLIDGLKNDEEYTVKVTGVSFKGRESEKSHEIKVKPRLMADEIKVFYKRAKILYISGKYKEALKEVSAAEKKSEKQADIVILKEKIEKTAKTAE